MATITFTASTTSASPAVTATAGVNLADADLATIITWAITAGGPVDSLGNPWTSDSTGSPQAMSPVQALQWLATSLMTGTLYNVQAWQKATAIAEVNIPVISVTPTT